MELLFAPMEGITGYIYRKIHSEMFGGADMYYSPFIAPDSTGRFKAGNLRDVLPENNIGVPLTPQILANNPDAFLAVAGELAEMGYDTVDLNVGCPSGTVTAKHKGAGMLCDVKALDVFLDRVFSSCPIKISVKTRLGVSNSTEFENVLAVYKKYPLSRLTVHTRCASGMYKSPTEPAAFSPALEAFGDRASYNGNIVSIERFNSLADMYPALASVMMGRGVIADPALMRTVKGGAKADKNEIRAFHDALLAKTLESGLFEIYTVGRMKELWFYMSHMFPDCDKQLKAINKSKYISDYNAAVSSLFSNCAFDRDSFFPC
ncbi:MAG: tRNA-dihydrouridine synthase family protein [Eubacteriales bacterium]|nr:tRNA-dihydrouridine synthase family protein [Eubacteriales bacterium]